MNLHSYVLALGDGRHEDVGAPAPLLSAEQRARATKRLSALSSSGDAKEMLEALGIRVVATTLPAAHPFALALGVVLVSAGASPAVRSLLTFAGLALASLRFEVAPFSSSDVWLVAASLCALQIVM